jgi:sulfite exporter TauE/SafE
MCGGFSVILGMTAEGRRNGLYRQLAYSLGRIFTYMVLGAVAGLLGGKLIALGASPSAVRIAAGLCVLAGLFLMFEGLIAAGFSFGRRGRAQSSCGGCLAGPLFTTFLKSTGLYNAFLGGLMTGFLPCGLLYAFLALAAARMHPLEGMAVMGAFGLGTVPLMVIAGVGSTFLSPVGRTRMLRVAAWCVVLTGALTVVRGAGYLTAEAPTDPAACPFCSAQAPAKDVATRD